MNTTEVEPTQETTAPIEAAEPGEERWLRLERVVRGMGRDSLTLTRGQQEAQASLATITSRLDELDLAIKGVSQAAWRSAQERLGQAQEAEKHFAVALRELEKRVHDELLWQIHRSAMLAIFPALDDMARVLSHQHELVGHGDDPFFEAMQLVHQKIVGALRVLGLDELKVEPGVTRFDPALHEAVEPRGGPATGEDVATGTILAVTRPGYLLQNRVFRAPQVLVKS